MIPIWGTSASSNLQALKTLQNRAIKCIKRFPHLHPTSDLYNEHILSLDCIIEYQSLILVYKIKFNLIKCNITLRTVSQIHSYNTRQTNNYYTIKQSTNCGKLNIFYQGLQNFDKLPNYIKNEPSLKIFQNKLRSYLCSNNR